MPIWVEPIALVIFVSLICTAIASPFLALLAWYISEPREVRAEQIKRLLEHCGVRY